MTPLEWGLVAALVVMIWLTLDVVAVAVYAAIIVAPAVVYTLCQHLF